MKENKTKNQIRLKKWISPLVGLVLLFNGCFRSKTEAEVCLDNFPSSLPHTQKVEKYRTDGAKTCLVHVKQFHYAPRMNKPLSQRVVRCQNDILGIFRYIEGTEQVLSESNVDYKHLLKEINREIEISKRVATWKNDVERLEKNLETYRKKLKAGIVKDPLVDAAQILDYEGSIETHSAEDALTNYLRLGEVHGDRKIGEWNERAEDGIIERATKLSNKGHSLVYTIYGAAHNFKDNVKKWNKKNPTNKVSLIEVTPTHL